MSAAYLTVRETADLLGVDHKTVRREIERGRLPALRVGRVLRINRAELDERLAYQSRTSSTAPYSVRPARPLGEFSRRARERGEGV